MTPSRRRGASVGVLRSREFLATALGGDAERASGCSAKSARRSSSKPTSSLVHAMTTTTTVTVARRTGDARRGERRKAGSVAKTRDGPPGGDAGRARRPLAGATRGVARRRKLVRAGFGLCPSGSGADADAAALAAETELLEARRAREDAELDAKMLREMRYGLRAADEEDAARDAREMESFATFGDGMTTRCEPSVEPGEEFALEDPTAAFAAAAASSAGARLNVCAPPYSPRRRPARFPRRTRRGTPRAARASFAPRCVWRRRPPAT